MKSIFAAFLLLISLQAVSQNVFYKVFDFMEEESEVSNRTWAVFEEEGGYVITGCRFHTHHGFFMFIIKTNYQGDTVWTKEVGPCSFDLVSHTQRPDSSKVFTVEDSIFLFDKDWNMTSLYPKTGLQHPRKIISLADGNYLFADRNAINNYSLVKVDSETLNVIWTSDQLIQDFLSGVGSGYDIESLIEMPNSEIVMITSNFYALPFGPDYFGSTFFHLDSQGILTDTTMIRGNYYYDTYIENGNLGSLVEGIGPRYSITTHTIDGEEIHSFSFPYNYDIFQILKNEDRVVVVRTLFQPKGFLVEEYKDETLLWSEQPPQPISLTEVVLTSDNGYLVYGQEFYGPGDSYPCLLKRISPLALNIPELMPTQYSTLYPNPVGDELIIDNTLESKGTGANIIIYNASGETVLTSQQQELPFKINTATLPGGLYFAKVITGSVIEILKFIKQ